MDDVEFEITLNINSVSADYDIDCHQVLLVDFDTGSHFLRLAFHDPDEVLSFADRLKEWAERFKAEYQPEPDPRFKAARESESYPVPRPKSAIDPGEMP